MNALSQKELYIYIKIKNLLETDNKDEITYLINQQINVFNKYPNSNVTENTLFNQHILEYINNLKTNGYHVKQIISVSKMYVNNEYIIQVIEKCIKVIEQYSLETKEFDLSILEEENYLILKISTKKVEDVPLSLEISKDKVIRKIDIVENNNDEIEIKILFKLDIEDNEKK